MSWSVALHLVVGDLGLQIAMDGNARPVALIGPNGSGKTTVLRTIAGAHHPLSGQITVAAHILFDSETGLSQPPEQRRVGYVPQGYGLFPHLSVLDNVAFGLLGQGKSLTRSDREDRAMEQLKQLGCAHLADRQPETLSGGEQQNVALARALIVEPRILLLDEPLSALDAAARRKLRAYLAERLAAEAIPAIVVTHDVRDVLALGAYVYVLEAGRIVQHGDPELLREKPVTDFVAEFFHAEE